MATCEFQLSAFLPYRLALLSERTSRRLSVVYGKTYGLTGAEWRVLVHLNRCQSVSVREIHNCVNLEKSRVSRAVKRLETDGLVVKLPGAEDARLVEISLSEKGQSVLADILPKALSFERRLLENISKQDMQVFLSVMETIHDVLDKDPQARPRSQVDLKEIKAGS